MAGEQHQLLRWCYHSLAFPTAPWPSSMASGQSFPCTSARRNRQWPRSNTYCKIWRFHKWPNSATRKLHWIFPNLRHHWSAGYSTVFFLAWLRTWDRSLTCAAVLTFTCQTLLRISYEPGPTPVSAASPPIILFHCCNVKTVSVFHRESRIIPYPSQTALRSWRRDRLQQDTRNMLKWLRKVGWMWRFHLYHLVNISMLAYKNGLSYL